MCQYAAIHPMTEEELQYAMRDAPKELRDSESYKGSVRYGYCVLKEGNMNGEKLMALRARIADAKRQAIGREGAASSSRSPHGKPTLEKNYARKTKKREPKKARKAEEPKKRKRKHAKRKSAKKPKLQTSEPTWATASEPSIKTPDPQIGHTPAQGGFDFKKVGTHV